jgi:hypothetical protein
VFAVTVKGEVTVAPLVGLVTVIWPKAGAANATRAAKTVEAKKDLGVDMTLLWCHRGCVAGEVVRPALQLNRPPARGFGEIDSKALSF